ncbi:MAG: nuclear transport factor 2 family protein [Saprospiraceae bacterium]
MKTKTLLLLPAVAAVLSCTATKDVVKQELYVPQSKALYDQIVRMDSIWENAYDHCRMDVMDAVISADLEFYHDQTGLTTSKEAVMTAFKNNVCGKVTRELLPGSIEVYPIEHFGAVEMGRHRFFNNQEAPGAEHHYSRFIHIWKNDNGNWQITRVISLH